MTEEPGIEGLRALTDTDGTAPEKLRRALYHARCWFKLHHLDRLDVDERFTVLMPFEMYDSFRRDLSMDVILANAQTLGAKGIVFENALVLPADHIDRIQILMNVGLYIPPRSYV